MTKKLPNVCGNDVISMLLPPSSSLMFFSVETKPDCGITAKLFGPVCEFYFIQNLFFYNFLTGFNYVSKTVKVLVLSVAWIKSSGFFFFFFLTACLPNKKSEFLKSYKSCHAEGLPDFVLFFTFYDLVLKLLSKRNFLTILCPYPMTLTGQK